MDVFGTAHICLLPPIFALSVSKCNHPGGLRATKRPPIHVRTGGVHRLCVLFPEVATLEATMRLEKKYGTQFRLVFDATRLAMRPPSREQLEMSHLALVTRYINGTLSSFHLTTSDWSPGTSQNQATHVPRSPRCVISRGRLGTRTISSTLDLPHRRRSVRSVPGPPAGT